ncbi:UxaC [Acrasis kona]|uniref:UxaC n=1 Tax=Acrasis kona TaxID=1008807 RepID=A0AAW2ZSF9_9EUKA
MTLFNVENENCRLYRVLSLLTLVNENEHDLSKKINVKVVGAKAPKILSILYMNVMKNNSLNELDIITWTERPYNHIHTKK